MPLRRRRAWWKTALIWCAWAVGAVIVYAVAAAAKDAHWEVPWWGYALAFVFVFNYAYATVIERLDFIQSQLDDIASRFPDSREPDFL